MNRIAWPSRLAFTAAAILFTVGTLAAAAHKAEVLPPLRVTPVLTTPDVVRLELESTGPLEYTSYRAQPGVFTVEVAAVAVSGDSGARVLSSDLVPGYRITAFREEGRYFVRLEVRLDPLVDAQVERINPGKLSIVVVRPNSPVALGHPAAASLASVSATIAAPHSAAALTAMSAAPQNSAQSAPPSAPRTASQQPSATKYSGEPISVDLKDVELSDFFRLIHEISGLNVVLDPNVKGALTLDLDDVPWDQALDIVLHNNDLDKQLEGNLLRIATKDTLKKEAEEDRDLAKAQTEASAVVTTTRVLSYAKAEDLVTPLKRFLSARGDVLADSRSNTLIIRDVPSVMPVMDNLIRQWDRKSQQVEIEARVVAANRTFSREIGSQFGFATAATGGRNIFGGASGVGTSPIVRNSPPLPVPPLVGGNPPVTTGGSSSSLPLNSNLPVAVATSGLSYLFSSPSFALDYIITAAESKGTGKLLSRPRVATQNNTKATVKQGTKIPIQTIINNTISVQYVDAVLELEVTPQVTAEGTVFMDVHVENTQIDSAIPRVMGIPALDTQAADSKILVADGATIVIGGIILSNQQTTVDQVPLFGSIPVIGNLFRHTIVMTSSSELLFFLTPRILPS
jgi:type IV pilus assembly protein PilQ